MARYHTTLSFPRWMYLDIEVEAANEAQACELSLKYGEGEEHWKEYDSGLTSVVSVHMDGRATKIPVPVPFRAEAAGDIAELPRNYWAFVRALDKIVTAFDKGKPQDTAIMEGRELIREHQSAVNALRLDLTDQGCLSIDPTFDELPDQIRDDLISWAFREPAYMTSEDKAALAAIYKTLEYDSETGAYLSEFQAWDCRVCGIRCFEGPSTGPAVELFTNRREQDHEKWPAPAHWVKSYAREACDNCRSGAEPTSKPDSSSGDNPGGAC